MSEMMPIMPKNYLYKQEVAELRERPCAFAVIQIPWDLIKPHEAQAKQNHGQTLAQLRHRGGLSACEALAILEDRRWSRMDRGEANAKLAAVLMSRAGVAAVSPVSDTQQ
ncbi:MAG: hypothetical protein AAFR79_07520 [Pseudomonadota bacterium]